MLTGKTIDARKAKSLGLVDAVTQERHVRNAVKDAVFGRLKRARPGVLQHAPQSRPGARLSRHADARGGREGRAARALSGALCADRSLGEAWRQQGGDAGGRKALVRRPDGDADGAEPDPGVLPARADEEARRRRQQGRSTARHRRRRHGRRHRRVVRASGHPGHARGHEAGADRRRDQARGRSLRQDRPQADRDPRRARPADARPRRRGRAQRRSHHRGGAGKARAEAEGLCRHSSRR